jgi:magnesium transporter
MGGVAGTQTLTLMIRGLSIGHVISGNMRWLILKELGVGIINGLLWALVVGTLTYFWFSEEHALYLAVAIGAAMIVNLVVGVFAGAVLPIILKKMKIDPALSGGVILTTITDVVGFFALLGFATLFFT